MSLTQTKVDRAPVKNKDYRLTDAVGSGLNLRVYRTGGKSYFFRFTGVDGRQKDRKVGDATKISLKEARKRSLKLQEDLETGVGVGEEDAFGARTFQNLVDAYRESPKYNDLKPASK